MQLLKGPFFYNPNNLFSTIKNILFKGFFKCGEHFNHLKALCGMEGSGGSSWNRVNNLYFYECMADCIKAHLFYRAQNSVFYTEESFSSQYSS